MCDNNAHAVVPVNSKSERVGSKGATQCIGNERIPNIKKSDFDKF